MNILITSIVDLNKAAPNRLHHFINFLSKKHNISTICIKDWWKAKQVDTTKYYQDFKKMLDNIEIHYVTEKRMNPYEQEFLSPMLMKLPKDNFDVIFNYGTLISGYYITKKLKLPMVYDMADDLGAMIKDSPQIPRLLRPFGGVLGDLMVRKNIEKAEKVTVITDMLKRTYNIPADRVEIIPNGVDTNLFRNYGNAKEELGLDGFIIGYVGVLREWVDLEPVFGALKDLDAKIKMVVIGKEGGFNENVRLAKKCGVSDRVTFTGMVPYSQVPKYISAMDVCLIPFKANAISANALPLKLFEYMACEKPVISSKISGIKHVAEDKVMYAANKEEYKEKIAELYTDEELRRSIGKTGRKFVEKNYDWEKIVGRMEKTLIETAAG